MKANIDRGKLVAPKTLSAGLKRKKQLEYELSRIEAQLNDPMRRPDPHAATTATYLAWRESAERAIGLFKLELRLLNEWIDVRQSDSERLLREAYEAMKVLEVQVDFKPHETALMERLDDFFEPPLGRET